MSVVETWRCDREGCDEASPSTAIDSEPVGWVRLERYASYVNEDTIRHYCSWECAMHGTAHELECYEQRELEGADETR